MMRIWPLLSLLSGCSIVLVDEPCDTAVSGLEETGSAPELLFLAAGTGATHTCGILDDASLYCWGLGDEGQLDAPDGRFDSLSVGHAHACAIDEAGLVQCWGRNDAGQASLSGSFEAVSAGGEHTCGLDADGGVQCVGRNDQGQTDVPEYSFLSISAGATHTCGIVRLEGEATGSVCWGELKKAVSSDEAHLSIISGSGWACAESSVSVSCYGDDEDGQHSVTGGLRFGTLVSGARHGCGLNRDGLIRCWGGNDASQLDAPAGSYSALFSGPTSLHTCALGAGGVGAAPLTCWGLDAENQLTP